MIEEFKNKSLSGNTIKIIAIIAMIIDHVGWAFVSTNTIGEVVMHTDGKITGPIWKLKFLSDCSKGFESYLGYFIIIFI